MESIGVCIPTIEGGVIRHQEIGREAIGRGVAYPSIVTHPAIRGNQASYQHMILNQERRFLVTQSIEQPKPVWILLSPPQIPHISYIIKQQRSQQSLSVVFWRSHGYKRVGVLGTKPTVIWGLYDARLAKRGITAIYACERDQNFVHGIIQKEVIRGIFRDEIRDMLVSVAHQLAQKCDAIILGCTELPLVLNEENYGIKVVDTTSIVAHAALDVAFKE